MPEQVPLCKLSIPVDRLLKDCIVLDVKSMQETSIVLLFFPGECEGTRVSGIKPSDTREQCLIFCKEIEECKWFTFLIEFKVRS